MLRGWGNYFRTGNAATQFNQIDSYVVDDGCVRLRVKRKGRHLRPGEVARWTRDFFQTSGSIACAAPFSTRRLRNAATRETTGKPCAGNPHARFERGS